MQKESLILRQVENELIYDAQKAKMLEMASLAPWPSFDKEGKLFFTAMDAADGVWELMWDRMIPYLPISKEDRARTVHDTAKEAWEARFGPMDSPEVQAQIAAMEALMKREKIEARASASERNRIHRQQESMADKLYADRTLRRRMDLRG